MIYQKQNTYDKIIYNNKVSSDSKNAILIDPADDAASLIKTIDENQLCLKYIFITHGHTDGAMAIMVNDIIFSGDTLLYEKHGKTTLPGGNETTLINSIKKLMDDHPGNYIVYPGHRQETTLDHARQCKLSLTVTGY